MVQSPKNRRGPRLPAGGQRLKAWQREELIKSIANGMKRVATLEEVAAAVDETFLRLEGLRPADRAKVDEAVLARILAPMDDLRRRHAAQRELAQIRDRVVHLMHVVSPSRLDPQLGWFHVEPADDDCIASFNRFIERNIHPAVRQEEEDREADDRRRWAEELVAMDEVERNAALDNKARAEQDRLERLLTPEDLARLQDELMRDGVPLGTKTLRVQRKDAAAAVGVSASQARQVRRRQRQKSVTRSS